MDGLRNHPKSSGVGLLTTARGPLSLWDMHQAVEMVDKARAGPRIVKRLRSFGKGQRLAEGGIEQEPAALETCSTHGRRK